MGWRSQEDATAIEMKLSVSPMTTSIQWDGLECWIPEKVSALVVGAVSLARIRQWWASTV